MFTTNFKNLNNFKDLFLVFLILLGTTFTVDINKNSVLLLILTFIFYGLDIRISLLFIFLWALTLYRKKTTEKFQTDNPGNIEIIPTDNNTVDNAVDNEPPSTQKPREPETDFSSFEVADSIKPELSPQNADLIEREYKTTDELKKYSEMFENKDVNDDYVKLIDIVKIQFSSTMIVIINDILTLMKQDVNFSTIYDKYVYYIREIFYIFSEKGRLFYVGLLFMFISICLFFIEIT
jgi:hypothetical protein